MKPCLSMGGAGLEVKREDRAWLFLAGLWRWSLSELTPYTGEMSGRRKEDQVQAGSMVYTSRRKHSIIML